MAEETRWSMHMRALAEDCFNPQEPTPIEEDNQTVVLACRDRTGKTQALRHRRSTLSFMSSAVRWGQITVRPVAAADQTADAMTKVFGPLQHWRTVGWIQGIYLRQFSDSRRW